MSPEKDSVKKRCTKVTVRTFRNSYETQIEEKIEVDKQPTLSEIDLAIEKNNRFSAS